jgi:hypothetical protein
MEQEQLHLYARQMWEARGPKAIADASHKAADLEQRGNMNLARR